MGFGSWIFASVYMQGLPTTNYPVIRLSISQHYSVGSAGFWDLVYCFTLFHSEIYLFFKLHRRGGWEKRRMVKGMLIGRRVNGVSRTGWSKKKTTKDEGRG